MPVALGTGPPTREELLEYYPGRFTWPQLKTFVNSGDLGLLKRDRALQQRYMLWAVDIKEKFGSIVNFLLTFRLQWGETDKLSLLSSAFDDPDSPNTYIDPLSDSVVPTSKPPTLTADSPKYFTSQTPAEYISIIQNDWPYSVPADIEHALIWTRVPIFHPELIDPSIAARIEQDGLCGFTGSNSPPPSPSHLDECLPALEEWGITKENMILSPPMTAAEEQLVSRAGHEVHEFVKKRWIESEWETAWFVNPPRLQSVPGLAHVHVFAKKK